MNDFYVRPDAITADLDNDFDTADTTRMAPELDIPEIDVEADYYSQDMYWDDYDQSDPYSSSHTQDLPPVTSMPDKQFFPSVMPKSYSSEGRAVVLPPKKNNKRTVIALLAIIVVALIAAAIYFFGIYGARLVPDVVGLKEADAQTRLEQAGFSTEVRQVKSDDLEGIVLKTDPTGGSFAQKESIIVIEVSVPRTIPEVLGLQEAQAREVLQKDGYQNISVVNEKSNEPSNTVIAISPEVGALANASAPITLTISEPYTVPNTVGETESKAKELLQKEGYKVKVSYEYTENVTEGNVVSSVPPAGTQLASGSEVVINVAKSRSTELIELTKSWFAASKTYMLDGTNYELRSVDKVTYSGNNTCAFSVVMRPFETHSWFGQQPETRYGADKVITGTITYTANNQFESITPQLRRN